MAIRRPVHGSILSQYPPRQGHDLSSLPGNHNLDSHSNNCGHGENSSDNLIAPTPRKGCAEQAQCVCDAS